MSPNFAALLLGRQGTGDEHDGNRKPVGVDSTGRLQLRQGGEKKSQSRTAILSLQIVIYIFMGVPALSVLSVLSVHIQPAKWPAGPGA